MDKDLRERMKLWGGERVELTPDMPLAELGLGSEAYSEARTLRELMAMTQENERSQEEMCYQCGKKPAIDLPDNTIFCSEECLDAFSKAHWYTTTASELVTRMHREDVAKLRDVIKSVLPDYSTPWPIWQIADSLAKGVAGIDWEKELEGATIEWNPERMFPSEKEPVTASSDGDTFEF